MAEALGSRDRLHYFALSLADQSRGTFHSTEQLSLFGSAPANFRDYYTLAEYDIDFCVPSALLISHMLKYALVWEDFADTTATTVWLMKMAPRRWFRGPTDASAAESVSDAPPAAAVVVEDAATRLGRLNLTIAVPVTAPGGAITVEVSLGLGFGVTQPGSIKLRLRDPDDHRERVLAAVTPVVCAGATLAVDTGRNQTVDVALDDSAVGAPFSCSFVATLQ